MSLLHPSFPTYKLSAFCPITGGAIIVGKVPDDYCVRRSINYYQPPTIMVIYIYIYI